MAYQEFENEQVVIQQLNRLTRELEIAAQSNRVSPQTSIRLKLRAENLRSLAATLDPDDFIGTSNELLSHLNTLTLLTTEFDRQLIDLTDNGEDLFKLLDDVLVVGESLAELFSAKSTTLVTFVSTPSSSSTPSENVEFTALSKLSRKKYEVLLARAEEAVEELTISLFPNQQQGKPHFLPAHYGIIGIGYGLVDPSKHWIRVNQSFDFNSDLKLGTRIYVANLELLNFDLINGMVPKETRYGPVNIIQLHSMPGLSAATSGDGVKGSGGQGTLGCVVQKNGVKYLLSNSHVFGDTSNIADPIYHPDGPPTGTQIATLSESVDIDTSYGAINYVDAAIAEISASVGVSNLLHLIGPISPVVTSPVTYMSVRKFGNRSGHTVGIVMGVGVKINLAVGTGTAQFDKQIEIQGVGAAPFARSGDSGAIVVEAVTRMPVGLFIGSDRVSSFATPIQDVLNQFSVTVA